jgi:serine/threonine-protein kinase RsbT
MTIPADPVRLVIATDADIVIARQSGRDLADKLGCSSTDATLIATAISEIARNIVSYAGGGEVEISVVDDGDGHRGIEVVARDEGPGIELLDRAMEDGYTTGRGLGLGLPGARRLMDEFEIESRVGKGTTVVMRKWQR